MQPAQIIVLAAPLFVALIALEFWLGLRRGRNTYRLNDALSSLSLGLLSQLVGGLTKLFTLGAYLWVYEHWAWFPQLSAASVWVWLAALLLYDFLYYWHHRFGHTSALFWAAHAVHHQSEDYNLSTALRQTSSGWVAGWIFYLPMAVIGFPPLVFVSVGLIDLLYQYWVHTQQIGRLGWFDRWFCSPSNHRVHHAVNDVYLDRNYGGIFIFWDRLFGSFQEELDAQPCVYGTRDALRNWNPWVANWHVYGQLLRKTASVPGLINKLRVWWEPAHWQPAGQEPRAHPPFDPYAQQRFDPPLPPQRAWLAVLLFLLMLAATMVLLWNSHLLSVWQQLASLALVGLGLWAVAWLCSAPIGQRTSHSSASQRKC